MDTVTYSNEKVVKFIEDHYVPLRLGHDDEHFSKEYNLIWTPTLIVLDRDGKEYQRSTGFLDPDELVAFLKLGIAKEKIYRGNYDAARLHLDEILDDYPQSDAAPQALYFKGVNLYKKKDDPQELKKAYESLLEKYPGSTWAKRAVPYRHI